MRTLFAYLTIYLVWGSTYFAIKLCVQTIPPFWVVGLRFLLGGLFLIILIILKKRLKPFPTLKQFGSSMIIGCLLLIGGNGLITIAQRKVDSYLAALIVAACPMAVMMWDRFILRKKIRFVHIIGAVLGLTGVALLLYHGNLNFHVFSLEIGLMAAGVLLWALGTTLSKKLTLPNDNLVNAAIQLFGVGILVIVVLRPLIHIPAVASVGWSLTSILGLAYLTLFGSIALVAYAYLLKHEPNHRVVSYVFVNPPLAMFLGILAGKEMAVPFLVPALFLLLGGLALIFYGEKLMGKWSELISK